MIEAVSRHGGHLLLLGLPTLAFLVFGLRADLRARRATTSRRTGRQPVVVAAAVLSAAAAAVHVRVCPEHFGEAAIYGLFFLFAATAQLGWAALIWLRPRRSLLFAGAFGNAAVVALWVMTRTNGIPLGPGRGEVEAVGALDIVATGCELGVVLCAVALLGFPRLLAPRVTTVEA
jgi:hypothetical protein